MNEIWLERRGIKEGDADGAKVRVTARQRRTGLKRLLKLATFLTSIKPARFDFCSWVYVDVYESANRAYNADGIPYADFDYSAGLVKSKKEVKCGTTACACGWATTIPSFRKAGFKLKWQDDWDRAAPVFNGEHDENAAAEFFCLSWREAMALFIPGAEDSDLGGNATPREVRDHIRAFVKRTAKAEGIRL